MMIVSIYYNNSEISNAVILSVAVTIGFTYENYTVTEGVDMFTGITVGLVEGEIEQSVVVTIDTQADSAMGTFYPRCYASNKMCLVY